MLEFTNAEMRAKAVQLGIIKDGEDLPVGALSKIKAALVEDRRTAAHDNTAGMPPIASQIVIRPGAIEMDGRRLPAASDPIEIHVDPDPDIPSTVRLTLLADTVQTLKEKS